MKKVIKGTPGYLSHTKKVKGITVLIFVLIIIAMLTATMFVSDTVAVLLKICAILNVLPASNFFVHFVAMFPYHSRERAHYDRYTAQAAPCRVITELAITNPNGPTVSLPYMAFSADRVVGYYERVGKPDTLKKLPSAAEFSHYLEGRLRLSELDVPVELFTEEKKFAAQLSKLQAPQDDDQRTTIERIESALLANSF